MANKFPLTLDTSTNTIQELPSGDDLDLTGSNISNVIGITATGNITTTGNVTGNFILGNGSQLTGIVSSPGGSNTQLQFNNNGNFGGIANVTFASGNLSLGGVANVKMTGGTNNQYLKTDGNGNLSFDTISVSSSSISNGNSNVNIPSANGNIAVSVTGTANTVVFANTSTTINTPIRTANYVILGNFAGNTSNPSTEGRVAIGYGAGNGVQNNTSASDPTVAIGFQSGNTEQRQGSVAIGFKSGRSQQDACVAMGYESGLSQGPYSIAIGLSAGQGQGTSSIAVGTSAGLTSQSTQGIAIGQSAGRISQGTDAIAIGTESGRQSQAASAIAIGQLAGNLQATRAIAIGVQAGATSQSIDCLAIGTEAGFTGQAASAVAIGQASGRISQRTLAVAVGRSAGQSDQGTSSVAIGAFAGRTSQANNSIVINATGSDLDQTVANTFTVKPVRSTVTGNVMFYNNSTGEISFGATTGFTSALTTTANVNGNNVGATNFVVLASNTAANLASVTGVAGAMISVSDQDHQPAYWSVTDTRWKYVSNRANV